MRLLAIDGNSILNRAFYGIRLLSNQKGIYTNAIFGFMNIYFKHVSEVKPDRIVAAFDLKAPTFRYKAVETYKANSKGMPEELAMQLPYVKEILTLMGVPVVTCEGYEADDILGTLARICTEQDSECHIVTGDRDSLQLIDEKVTVRLVTNKDTIPYTPTLFEEEYGFAPLSMIDLKALMGDSSDNISGVAGVGQKTASGLIQKWGTIEKLYENIDRAGLTKGVYTKLTTGKAAAEQSKWLATIVKNAPIPEELSSYDKKPVQGGKLKALLLELEMAKLLSKLKLEETPAETDETAPEQESAAEAVSYPEETLTADILRTWENGQEAFAYLFDGTTLSVFHDCTIYQTEETALIKAFLGGGLRKRTFSAKPHYRYMLARDGELKNLLTDGEICAYLLNPTTSEYTIDRLCVTYHTPCPSPLAALAPLCDEMERLVKEQDMTELYALELRLTEVLASMEHAGVQVDTDCVLEVGV